MSIANELACDGVLPSGPVSGWPKERHESLMAQAAEYSEGDQPVRQPSAGKMAKGLLRTAGQAIRHGKISEEIREERYDTCKACPFFDAASKRCTDCGCFMEAKTWVGGDPNMLCPQKKWSR
jgi:hypothetical protein